jgi:hypothetical protein
LNVAGAEDARHRAFSGQPRRRSSIATRAPLVPAAARICPGQPPIGDKRRGSLSVVA